MFDVIAWIVIGLAGVGMYCLYNEISDWILEKIKEWRDKNKTSKDNLKKYK